MLPTGSINGEWRVVLLAVVGSLLTACGTTARVSDAKGAGGAGVAGTASAATAEPASPAILARYDSLLDRLRAGDSSAITDLESFSAEYPGFAGPLLNLGLMRARSGDEAGARALFERAIAVCSSCGAAWNELGVLHVRYGRFTEAEAAYHRAIEVEPGYAAAYYNLAIVYELYVPRPELALQNYEQYLLLGGDAGEGQAVQKWVTELRRQVGATPTAARAEGTP